MYSSEKITEDCDECGKSFKTGWLDADHYFCSKKCRLAYHARPKDASLIIMKMNPYPFEKKLKEYEVKTKEELEKAVMAQFNLDAAKGDKLVIRVVKGKIRR